MGGRGYGEKLSQFSGLTECVILTFQGRTQRTANVSCGSVSGVTQSAIFIAPSGLSDYPSYVWAKLSGLGSNLNGDLGLGQGIDDYFCGGMGG